MVDRHIVDEATSSRLGEDVQIPNQAAFTGRLSLGF